MLFSYHFSIFLLFCIIPSFFCPFLLLSFHLLSSQWKASFHLQQLCLYPFIVFYFIFNLPYLYKIYLELNISYSWTSSFHWSVLSEKVLKSETNSISTQTLLSRLSAITKCTFGKIQNRHPNFTSFIILTLILKV